MSINIKYKPKLLFILKKRQKLDTKSEIYVGLSTGLYNSVKFIHDMLGDIGSDIIESKMYIANDNNDIDREVTKYKPTHVIIEALWVVPDKFKILEKLHPRVKWIIRLHSELPFIAGEGIAMKLIGDYCKYKNVIIACNAPRMLEEIRFYVSCILNIKNFNINNKVIYLPNYYPKDYKTKTFRFNDYNNYNNYINNININNINEEINIKENMNNENMNNENKNNKRTFKSRFLNCFKKSNNIYIINNKEEQKENEGREKNEKEEVKNNTEENNIINIGCFGAVRPLKNHLIQAFSAIKFANSINKKLYFHINCDRHEMNGLPAYHNLVGLFDQLSESGHKLVLHEWCDHDEFLLLCSKMDIGLQVSFTETFNIVSADLITMGVPIVASNELPWVSELYSSNPVDSSSIYDKLCLTYYNPDDNVKKNIEGLSKYVDNTKDIWNKYFYIQSLNNSFISNV